MLTLLLACTPAPIDIPKETGGESGLDSAETAETADSGESADSAESGDSGETAETAETGDTGETGETAETGDTAPAELGRPRITPDGGAFIGKVDVTLEVRDGEGDLTWCVSDPEDDTCVMQPYTGPVSVSSSTIFRAQVTRDGETSDIVGRAFIEVAAELAGFSSTIPVIVYATPGRAPDSTTDVAMEMVLVEPGKAGTAALTDPASNTGRARLHTRGSSSAGWPKKSWDLELWESDSDADRTDELLGMPENGDWVLYAPYYYDEAMIRNPLAFAMGEALGRYEPRARFVEVFVASNGQAVRNRDYQGVYVLMEEVERAADRVNIVELTPKDLAEPEVTGGYLFKIDRPGTGESGFPSQTGTAGREFDFQQPFVAVDPAEDELELEQRAYLVSRLNSLGYAVAADDGIDPGTGLHYSEIMDVGSFIDHHIVDLVMKNPDALRLSNYLYQDRSGLVTEGPVWDFDRAAASQDSRASQPTWWDAQNLTSDCTPMFTFGWYEGLFEDPDFSTAYWSRLSGALDAELSNAQIDTMIDGLIVGLEEPAARDAAKWGQAEFTSEVEELRAWLHTRRDWMRACIDTYPDPRDCPG